MLTGLCFDSKLKKCDEDLFVLVAMKENWRPSQKIVLQRQWKLCMKISPYTSAALKQAAWKLLSEISRTAPGFHT